MVEFTVIDANRAPAQKPGPSAVQRRMREYEEYVRSVKRGEVGRLVPSKGDTVRGIALRVGRAATRVGLAAESWVVDGVVYFRVA